MRLLSAIIAAVQAFLRSIWRAARQLFHEITGAFFVLFASMGAVSAWRHWQRGSEIWLIGLSLAFALMMAAFAFASFRSARRVR
jgi:glycerol uptake facilitator-like aquaporin